MSNIIETNEFDTKRLQRLAEIAIDCAKKNGATDTEVGVSDGRGLSVTVRLGEIETLEYHQDQTLNITVYKAGKKGSASTSDFSERAVKEIVKAACSIANYTADDAYAGLVDAALMAKKIPNLDLYHSWNVSPEQVTDIAKSCEDAARAYDKRISNSEGATVTSYQGFNIYANTNGFIGGYPLSRHSTNCIVIAGEGNNMQRDFWYSTVRDPSQLESATTIGERAAEKTIQRLGAKKLDTRQVPVLFAPDMARGLIGHFVGAVRGKSLYRKASFLLDQKGETVFPEFITLRQEPHLPKALGSAPYDNDGVATHAWNIIENGILMDYVLDGYSARKLGMHTTGNAGGVHNLIVSSGEHTQEDLMRQMDKGVLITEMMGHGVNAVNGDYSRGAVGFWIENGEIQFPIEEITVAGNLKDIFKGIVAVGNDVDMRGNIRSGSILVDNMTVAGN